MANQESDGSVERFGAGNFDPETSELLVQATIDDLIADLGAIIPWLTHPAFLADPDRVARFASELDQARDQLPGVYFDCACPDREAIVTGDGMICGSCGLPINPDPALVV
jgi:hypothetical protein